MAKYGVVYTTTASFVIEVEVLDGLEEDEAKERARELADERYAVDARSGLCWQCAGDYDLGDFEQSDESSGVYRRD